MGHSRGASHDFSAALELFQADAVLGNCCPRDAGTPLRASKPPKGGTPYLFCSPCGAGQHFAYFDWLPSPALAQIRCFHKGEDLDRLFRVHGRDSGFKELYDLPDQWDVAVKRTD